MTLIRWNSSPELDRLPSDFSGIHREMNRMFGNFIRGGVQADGNFITSFWTPAVDIAEQGNGYIVKMELPGVNKVDVKISLESNILTIKGEKHQEKEEKERTVNRRERIYGSFQRSFALPVTLKSDNIEAVFENGILSISLPKAEELKPKPIEVRVK
ncbi:MAG: Hsp20/alpha crystallin family protein [Ignavibacteriales bacterium]|nr:Hsp20/alpha crystallin family protein [Ignavibacteriales bacterium]